ncbi:MAG: biotin/lipoate A/B protein ligase family protein [Faecalibacterium sp.]
MLFFDSPFTNPYQNLALEEHLFTTLPTGESALLLWQNENTIVVGKHQNAAQEINPDYVATHGIKVARRLSGGGAVYHDMGNLNFTIITPTAAFEALHFQSFVKPVLETLTFFGLQGEFTGRNDITLDGKKICGNAQYAKNGKLLHHGCIMLSTDLSQVGKALRANAKKFDTKAVKSVASRVTTINTQAQAPIQMAEFKAKLTAFALAESPMQPLTLSTADRAAITQLSEEKYSTVAWIYHRLPTSDAQHPTPAGHATTNTRQTMRTGHPQRTVHTGQPQTDTAQITKEMRFAWGVVQATITLTMQHVQAGERTSNELLPQTPDKCATQQPQPNAPLSQPNKTAQSPTIVDITFTGDFFEGKPIETLALLLIGLPLNETLLSTLRTLHISDYLQGCTSEDLYKLLIL